MGVQLGRVVVDGVGGVLPCGGEEHAGLDLVVGRGAGREEQRGADKLQVVAGVDDLLLQQEEGSLQAGLEVCEGVEGLVHHLHAHGAGGGLALAVGELQGHLGLGSGPVLGLVRGHLDRELVLCGHVDQPLVREEPVPGVAVGLDDQRPLEVVAQLEVHQALAAHQLHRLGVHGGVLPHHIQDGRSGPGRGLDGDLGGLPLAVEGLVQRESEHLRGRITDEEGVLVGCAVGEVEGVVGALGAGAQLDLVGGHARGRHVDHPLGQPLDSHRARDGLARGIGEHEEEVHRAAGGDHLLVRHHLEHLLTVCQHNRGLARGLGPGGVNDLGQQQHAVAVGGGGDRESVGAAAVGLAQHLLDRLGGSAGQRRELDVAPLHGLAKEVVHLHPAAHRLSRLVEAAVDGDVHLELGQGVAIHLELLHPYAGAHGHPHLVLTQVQQPGQGEAQRGDAVGVRGGVLLEDLVALGVLHLDEQLLAAHRDHPWLFHGQGADEHGLARLVQGLVRGQQHLPLLLDEHGVAALVIVRLHLDVSAALLCRAEAELGRILAQLVGLARGQGAVLGGAVSAKHHAHAAVRDARAAPRIHDLDAEDALLAHGKAVIAHHHEARAAHRHEQGAPAPQGAVWQLHPVVDDIAPQVAQGFNRRGAEGDRHRLGGRVQGERRGALAHHGLLAQGQQVHLQGALEVSLAGQPLQRKGH